MVAGGGNFCTMARGRKRKNSGDGEQPSKSKTNKCIIHVVKGIKHETFTPLANITDPVARLEKLHTIRGWRLSATSNSPAHRMEDICRQIPDSLDGCDLTVTGYHRGCYQYFSKNLDCLTYGEEVTEPQTQHRSPRKSGKATILFDPVCIFCEQEGSIHVNIKNTRTTERLIKFSLAESWQKIESKAVEKGDYTLLRKIKGIDLLAAEAQFHPNCRKKFEHQESRGRTKRTKSFHGLQLWLT